MHPSRRPGQVRGVIGDDWSSCESLFTLLCSQGGLPWCRSSAPSPPREPGPQGTMAIKQRWWAKHCMTGRNREATAAPVVREWSLRKRHSEGALREKLDEMLEGEVGSFNNRQLQIAKGARPDETKQQKKKKSGNAFSF